VNKTQNDEIKLVGVPASPGIAIGTALVIGTIKDNIEKKSILTEEVENELNRFEEAIDITKKQIFKIQQQVEKELDDDQARIFDAHLLILDDHILINSVKAEVKKELINVEYIFHKKIQYYIKAISRIEDPYIRERGADIRDVGSRVIANLHGQDVESLKHLPGQRIIITPDLSPSDTVSLDRENVQAFATATGSRTSHAAIMARSMKIPAVLAVKEAISKIKSGNIVIIDGYAGIITVNPSAESLKFYAQKETRGGKIRENLIKESNLRPETIDGFRVQLAANIEFIDDIIDAKKYRAAGIGLYRTEYLYINSKELPDEEMQFENYKEIAVKMKGCHVIIRTLDIGGDKLKDNLSLNYEDNPFLGYRAIRLSLGFPELMKTQLRAILRASAYGNIKIMFPMISCMEELDKTLEILDSVKADLKEKKIPFNKDMEVGTMIETPSAALIADKLAEKVDFFSIGTNDLVQYTLAVDRNSEKVAYLYQPSHPAILTLIRSITDAAKRNGIWVSVCGEMAGDPQYTPLLLGMGVHELSMSPVSMGLIRRIIRKTRMFEVEEIVDSAQECTTAKSALKLSLDYLKKIEPDIYNLTIKGV
jgi:phosphoenolpyruvate-protein phosphotransferase (PTS system enzyme I)